MEKSIIANSEHCTLLRWYVSPLGNRHWTIKPVYRCNINGEEFTKFVASQCDVFTSKRDAKKEASKRNSEIE